MLTNTPILSLPWLILYAAQLMRFKAVLVITSDPPCARQPSDLATLPVALDQLPLENSNAAQITPHSH